MISQIRLAARALQSRNAAAFLLLFFGEALALLALPTGAFLLWRAALSPILRFGAAGLLALCALWLPALFWRGNAAFFFETAERGKARFGVFFSALHPKKAVRAFAAFWLCMLCRLGFFLLSFFPLAAMLAVSFRLLRQGICLLCAAFLAGGCAAAALLGIGCFLRFSDLLFLAPYDASAVRFLRQSAAASGKADRALFRLRRGFFGWFFACFLLLPLPFVWGYYQQTRALFARCLKAEHENRPPP